MSFPFFDRIGVDDFYVYLSFSRMFVSTFKIVLDRLRTSNLLLSMILNDSRENATRSMSVCESKLAVLLRRFIHKKGKNVYFFNLTTSLSI